MSREARSGPQNCLFGGDESSEAGRTFALPGVRRLACSCRPLTKWWDDDRIVSISVSYSEPAVLWRLRDPDGNRVRATIIPGVPQSTLVIFVNDRFERGENFEEWALALARADEVRASLVEAGWRPE